MNLEDLMNIKITSVSKTEQKLSRTAAAVFVISQEDIRRSGATSIPDLLRMAPGVNVQQIDANAWAIGIRGFSTRYANKVLVLIDGRAVYSPAFSGVFWEHLDIPLEDIDRIVVIRGPGATVWGTNAVNGVISIITKRSENTKGALITAGAGSQLNAVGLAQFGGGVGDRGSYRVFGKFFQVGASKMADGSPADDHWRRSHAGFRSDWNLTGRDSLMVQGDLFANQANQTRRPGFVATPFDVFSHQDSDAAGGNLLTLWTHTLAGGSQTSVRSYYDSYRRTDYGVPESLRTFDFDFQHHLTAGSRHDIVWGLGYRVNRSSLSPGYSLSYWPPSRIDNLFSGFLQDDIRLSNALSLTLGWRLEHNAYTGTQNEPSARLAWNSRGNRHTVWATAAKAIRQPARYESDIDLLLATIPAGPNLVQVIRLNGNPHLKEEEIRDFGAGYRSELTKTLSLDVATFLSFYRNLETSETLPTSIIPGSPVQILVPRTFENNARATNYGGEAALNWNASAGWRISPGYSYLRANLRVDPTSQGALTSDIVRDFPGNTFQIRSLLNLSRRLEFDQSLYYTARHGASIPGRMRLDLRLSKLVGESTELSLVGQNLLRPRSPEYGDSNAIIGTQAVRSVYGKITWRF